MATVRVLRSFYDLKAHADRMPGDTFEATDERAAQIKAALPDYVSVENPEPVDYASMTAQQLTAIAKERGVMPKGRVSKAALVKILSEE